MKHYVYICQLYIVYILVHMNFIAGVGPHVPVISLAVMIDKNYRSYAMAHVG